MVSLRRVTIYRDLVGGGAGRPDVRPLQKVRI